MSYGGYGTASISYDLISGYVSLKKTGKNWLGLCPFHSEKTPSFNVNTEKQIFHCFGCGVGGDVFKFVELQEGLNFPEAVKTLAARAGITLPQDTRDHAAGQKDRGREKGAAQDRRRGRRVLSERARRARRKRCAGVSQKARRQRCDRAGVRARLCAARMGRPAEAPEAKELYPCPDGTGRAGGQAKRGRRILRPVPGQDHLPDPRYDRPR